jgi:catechol 2,3-dioxygenase-like lactoylglutathione lyase family enzyme
VKNLVNEGLKRITQVAIVVKDIEKARLAWAELLGMKESQISETGDWQQTKMSYKGRPLKARAKLVFFNLENITLELIEPIGKPSTWQQFADETGGGLHHIAFNVADLDGTLKRFKEAGINVEQKGDYKGGCYVYVDSASKLGGTIELLHNYKK